MIPNHAPTTLSAEYNRARVSTERRATVESLSIAPREDGKIITGYKSTAFKSLYGPNGVENVIWADYFEKNNAVCG